MTAAFGAKCGAFPNFFLYTPQVCRESFLWDANNRKCVRNRRGGGEERERERERQTEREKKKQTERERER